MERYICIHGHFYQPPRENPWLEEIELQDSAYPYHDWNEKIAAECYDPNTVSRILDLDRRIVNIVNNYASISFDFGPTLISWMERHRPETYQAILEADRLSRERFSGHGVAMAQVYNHMIMPLADKRDKYTQVLWGIKDFQKRYGRSPEGMWLSETAVDLETLGVLAEQGIKFTILAPRQAKRVRKLIKGARWQDVTDGRVDPTMAYLCILPSRKSICLFFYDGPISQDLAFGDILNTGEGFAHRLLSAFSDQRDWPQIVHVATDGETYGHHHSFGDMALAYCLNFIQSQNTARITNYGEYLEKHPPAYLAEIYENSSWSCVHGVERWRDNCGCNSGTHPGWSQAWRKPLREALDGVRDRLASLYEEEASKYLKDPWRARDDYIDVVLDRGPENTKKFFEAHALEELSQEEQVRVLKLLEMQRQAMLMFTSCGWFFDEISGMETIQAMQYAARAIQHAEELTGISHSRDFLQALEKASTNIPQFENGARVYEAFVKPAMLDLQRVGGHWAISSLFEEYPESTRIYSYTTKREVYDRAEAGKMKLATGTTRVISEITGEEEPISFAVLHIGDHMLNGGVKKQMAPEAFSAMQKGIKEAFLRSDVPEIIRLMDKHFGMKNYSLWHLFRDEQRKVTKQLLGPALIGIESTFREIYEQNVPIMNFLQSIGMPLPNGMRVTAETILNMDLRRIFEKEELDLPKLQALVEEGRKWFLGIDKTTLGFAARSRIDSLMKNLVRNPEQIAMIEEIRKILESALSLSLQLDLWNAQNLFFFIDKKFCTGVKERAGKGDDLARQWIEVFHQLGSLLQVKVS